MREAGLHLQQDGEEAHRVGRDQQGQWVDQERLRPGRHGLRGEGMDKGIQRDTEDHKGDKRACGAAHKAPGPRRKGRRPKEAEPGINDCDLFRVIDYYFHDLVAWLRGLEDFRRKNSVYYPQALLILLCIIERICGNSSCRQHDLDKHERPFISNVMRLAGCDTEYLPHSDTMRYYLERCRRENLASIPPRMFGQLLHERQVYGLRSKVALGTAARASWSPSTASTGTRRVPRWKGPPTGRTRTAGRNTCTWRSRPP